ncbi:hypothetical protein [Gluconacetobacter takamatsuzukensis]|uniref:Uncharacterized protein n=1 Tax=Gluconacetobacter takamatsuzukensis TaxID=1286190 RepID=A0A7W4KFK8_9PROT|nr:hypothetical protein [Gluconacetobacter takamatsuzukensis]MBB2206027.1 hypothetical protein [Gluconacetobacter takamatsuzukensis]
MGKAADRPVRQERGAEERYPAPGVSSPPEARPDPDAQTPPAPEPVPQDLPEPLTLPEQGEGAGKDGG